jgi:hypothetical protein
MSNDLNDKAIDIKGKQYIQVKDRIIFFNETYKNGSIITQLLSQPSDKMVIVKAKVTPDLGHAERYFTGLSQAIWGEGMVNKTSALENAETSAVGRALGMMGIGILDSVASADEMVKSGADKPIYASDKQLNLINKMIKQGSIDSEIGKEIASMTRDRASEIIKIGLEKYNAKGHYEQTMAVSE